MDSLSGRTEYESAAKRIKLDPSPSHLDVLCKNERFSNISATDKGPIDTNEDVTSENTHNCIVPNADLEETSIATEATDFCSLDVTQDSLDLDVDDDNASTISQLSGLSDISGEEWKPMAGSMIWIQKQMHNGADPRSLLNELGADSSQIPEYLDDVMLWKLIINMLAEPPQRHKLRHVNTLDDVVRLLKGAQNIVVLTGAGVSVSCGIPDFRSRDGIYLRLAADFPNLPDPQAMFDINFFNQDPRPFYKFAKDIYPGNFQPSPCHNFIKLLESQNKLLRNYTQNIDTLEKVANIDKVIECHGSFATATCTKCGHCVAADEIREPILEQKIPLCQKCHGEGHSWIKPDDIKEQQALSDLVLSGIMKPDIVFFGEGLPDSFHEAMGEDKNRCDLLLVIGSSLKVRPVALIPSSLPANVPQILINREPLPHCHFDVELLGDCDIIVNHLCQLMGQQWQRGVHTTEKLRETLHLLPLENEYNLDSKKLKSFLTSSKTERDSLDSSSLSFSLDSTEMSESLDNEKQASINSKQLSVPEADIASSMEQRAMKERHMSIDSARDSGIGENSNFTDAEKLDTSDVPEFDDSQESCTAHFREVSDSSKSATPDLRGYWQPKIKVNMADRLPPNSFYLVPPSRYVFPGAEIFYDPHEKYAYLDDVSSSDSSDSESEADNDGQDNAF